MISEFSIFASSITDTKILYLLIDKLRAISKELYHNQEGTITQKVKNINPSLVAIFNYLEQNGLEPTGDAAQKDYLENIIKYLQRLPIVKITTAFEPDDTFSTRLNEVITNLINKKIVLDITVNHHIVAGIILEYNGKFADYSYEQATDKFLATKLSTFLTVGSEKRVEPEKKEVVVAV